ncbi:MAG: translational GTPase TypA [Chloroflexi bacterium]|nr:translational GTPase TypA [Chloroflexota bacterium]
MTTRNDIRNIAIIAHVDHGKTTLVDAMLKQSHIFRDNQVVQERVMDSNDLERERGITILAKNTAITYRGVKINIIDTPGHADFGGEVERVLNMADGVLLLVDAVDGPMPQTRFVLRKALELGHQAIVVINKVDRPHARLNHVANATFDLFVDLGATDEQAEFPIVYTDALTGRATLDPHLAQRAFNALPSLMLPSPRGRGVGGEGDLQPLFDTILEYIPAPEIAPDDPLQLLVTSLAYDDYKGRIAIGRVFAGQIRKAQEVMRIDVHGVMEKNKIAELFVHQGLERIPVDQAEAGEIVAVTGLPEVFIGETIADAVAPKALPPIRVEAPTVRMTFAVNTSPFGGREGQWSTSRKLRERLFKELEHNVSLTVQETENADTFIVSGRGELHLAILIETMRREGYEFQVAKPEVIFHTGAHGEKLEPYEDVFIEVAQDSLGAVMEMLGTRRGQTTEMHHSDDGSAHLRYRVPTRGLLGFRSKFLTATRGTGIMHALFAGYHPLAGDIATRTHGSLVAHEPGTATTFGLSNAEGRGILFIGPGAEVYMGMVVGENPREEDVVVNVAKKKHLTNMRSSNADIAIQLTPPRNMSLDDAIEYISEDELLEVTPLNIRLRKKILNNEERGKLKKSAEKAREAEKAMA